MQISAQVNKLGSTRGCQAAKKQLYDDAARTLIFIYVYPFYVFFYSNKGDKLMSSQLIVMQIVARDSDPKDDLILYTNPFLNCDDGCRPLK